MKKYIEKVIKKNKMYIFFVTIAKPMISITFQYNVYAYIEISFQLIKLSISHYNHLVYS